MKTITISKENVFYINVVRLFIHKLLMNNFPFANITHLLHIIYK